MNMWGQSCSGAAAQWLIDQGNSCNPAASYGGFFFLWTINTKVNICFVSIQVDYDNHPLYKHGKTGRKQSPVRLFTNISPRDVVLPKEEGYRYERTWATHRLLSSYQRIKCQRYVWGSIETVSPIHRLSTREHCYIYYSSHYIFWSHF